MPGRERVELLGHRAPRTTLAKALTAARAHGQGSALQLSGDAGVGKSALLAYASAEQRARRGTCVRISAVESERGLPYAVLHQLVYALRASLARLPSSPRGVLETLLGSHPPGLAPVNALPHPLLGGRDADEEAWDQRSFSLSVSLLALLHEAAEEAGSLLVCVDDAQWTDVPSARVLGFIARRLRTEPVVLLTAIRADRAGGLADEHLPPVRVPPLEAEDAERLLRLRFPDLAPEVRTAVLRGARGNPRALLDLPALLDADQRTGRAPLPDPLPVTPRVARPVLERVTALSPAAAELLMLAVVEGDATLRTLWAVQPGAGDALAELERAGLARVPPGGERLEFPEPLVRAALLHDAEPGHLRTAHRMLADAPDQTAERRAAHLSAAALGVDETAAQALQEAALQVGGEGAAATAVAALRRAADLSPRPAGRTRRLALAAAAAARSGLLTEAADLTRHTAVVTAGPVDRMYTALAEAALLLDHECDPDSAVDCLVDALALGSSLTDEETDLTALRGELGSALLFARAMAGSAPVLNTSSPAGPASGPGEEALLVGPAGPDPSWRLLSRAWHELAAHGSLGLSRPGTKWSVARAGERGEVPTRVQGLLLLARDAYTRGRWQEGEAFALEAATLAESRGLRVSRAFAAAQASLFAAVRGDVAAAHRRLATAEEGVPGCCTGVRAAAAHTRLMLALAREDGVAAASAGASLPADSTVLGDSLLFDRVEAALVAGMPRVARDLLSPDAAAAGGGAPERRAVPARAAGVLLTEAGGAEAALAGLPSVLRDVAAPFEKARVQLFLGRRLAEAGAKEQAAALLDAAATAFRGIHAVPWLERTRSVRRGLRITGQSPLVQGELTSQELQIARLAASGLSNRQIGARLFVSHRTVSTHLYNLFPKLNVASRAALRDALQAAGLDGAEPAVSGDAEDRDGGDAEAT
ncbi:LuxR C-terminal-related transcriptional regulator [Streptomyces sp. NPDC035033]|uniref:helix-turn-helix transcriptional regulator n=1 Tax=Streptomyces sp. NPDC035033 TaxID=3155368 RepID=UPI003407302C